MRTIIGIMIFWMTIIGLNQLLQNKFKVIKEFSLAITFTVIGIMMFIAGILNIMVWISALLTIIGIVYLGICIKKKTIHLKDLKNPNTIIIILLYTYITIVSLQMHITHYDNFSHWGLIIRNMFGDNALPNFEDTIIGFKGYQPGSACFIYFVGLVCGKTESVMILGQNYLIFSYITVLFAFIKNNCQFIKKILIVTFYAFMTIVLIRFNDLLVDNLISIMTIASLGILYYYRNDLKKGFTYSLPIFIYLLLVKNIGLILVGLNCLYILYLSYKNKNIKQGIKYVFITGIILLTFLIIWQGHVSLAYGETALDSKHALTPENIISELRDKGKSNIFQFAKDYCVHLFTLKGNISNVYMVAIDIILIIIMLLESDKRKILKLIIAVNMMYIGYWGLLGLMYIFSMPWEEAVIFAGYERYMNTIVIISIGLILIYLLQRKEKNNLYNGLYILICCAMLTTIYLRPQNAKSLIGIDDYKGSKVERYDNLLPEIKENNKKYYIYDLSSKNDSGYMFYLSRYKLKSSNVVIIENIEELKKVKNGTIILFSEINKSLVEYLSYNQWKKVSSSIYTK